MEEQEKKPAEKRSLKAIFTNGIWRNNPILMSLLAFCPTLAVTGKLSNAIGMAFIFTLILVISNLVVSAIRFFVPNGIRIPIFIVVIATTVTLIELLAQAYLYSIFQSLGIYLSLIVVNCIVMYRAEEFASKKQNTLIHSLMDALGMAIGFACVIIIVASVREFLSTGGLVILNPVNGDIILDTKEFFVGGVYSAYMRDPLQGIINNGNVTPTMPSIVQFRERMILPIFGKPVGAFLTIGALLGCVNWYMLAKEAKQKEQK